MKTFWFDTETTGLDSRTSDITQLAYQLVVDGKTVAYDSVLMCPLNPDAISEEALKVQGKTRDEVMAYPPAKDGYEKIVATMSQHIDKFNKQDKACPAGYNVWFDYQFLTALPSKLGDKYGFGSFLNHTIMDPLFIVNTLIGLGIIEKPANRKLETVCKYFGIEIPQAHDAIFDIRATRKLYSILVSKLSWDGKLFTEYLAPKGK